MNNKKALLVADDEPELLVLLSRILSPLGHPIVTANNGRELVDAVFSNASIAAVLSDISMPEMNGIEALQEIRARGLHIPLVFLTGHGSKEIMAEALRLGAHDFLEKPFRNDHLKSVVAQAMDLGIQLKGAGAEVVPEEELDRFREMRKPTQRRRMKK